MVSMTDVDAPGHRIEVTHGDRIIFPDADVTKARVIDYYDRVADRLLPHLYNRPLVMHRFPDGVDGDRFFQKQAPAHFPDWIATAELTRRGGGSVEHVVVCDDAAALRYIVNQGAFELHTLLAPSDRADHPDQLVIDLDPSTPDIGPVVEAARTTRRLLRRLDVPSFVKATGSRGVHIHIPLDGSAGVDDVRTTARRLAERIVDDDPAAFTVVQAKKDRGDRVFIDYLRNGYAQHAVAPYSLRARPTAPVAVPMDWDEVTASSFDPGAFRVDNVFHRLARKRDPWEGWNDVAHRLSDLDGALDRLAT